MLRRPVKPVCGHRPRYRQRARGGRRGCGAWMCSRTRTARETWPGWLSSARVSGHRRGAGGRCPVTGMHRADFTDGVAESLKPAVELAWADRSAAKACRSPFRVPWRPRQALHDIYPGTEVGGTDRRREPGPGLSSNAGDVSLDDLGAGQPREGTEFYNPVEEGVQGRWWRAMPARSHSAHTCGQPARSRSPYLPKRT